MGQKYKQLTIEERCEIARLYSSGTSIRKIASALDRQPSTVFRELKRNISKQKGYQPTYAQQQARARRWTGSKLDRDDALRAKVLALLRRGWSPEQVSGRLALDCGQPVISYETIYRFIYAQLNRNMNYSWRHYLTQAKSKRGLRSRKGSSPASFILHRRPISERSKQAIDRQTPGHWEADLMMFRKHGQNILALHERHSRLLLAVKFTSKSAEPIAKTIYYLLQPLPREWRQTVTFDNGTEFAQHHKLHDLNIETFFCDTYSPWQKGGVENAIGRLRRTLPRKTDITTITNDHLIELIQIYNNTPRKCLDFQTPAEVFWNKLLHFKCESIPLPSQG